jgi:xylulokinase
MLLWPKDYVRYRLTGRFLTDVTEGAGAGLLDWEQRSWSEERVRYVGLDTSVLPPLAAPTDDAGRLLPEIAQQWGFAPDARVIVGAGDVMALIGAAPPRVGRITFSLGSSGMISSALPEGYCLRDPYHRVHTYPFLHQPLLNAILSTSGASLTWAHKALYDKGTPLEDVVANAHSTPPGADGLLFLPYLMGERSPYWNDDLRGSFSGLALHHNRSHMIRAIMEGVAFSLRHIIEIATGMGIHFDEIALAGGGTAVTGWPQIFADVCQLPVIIYAGEETVTRPLYAHCRTALDNTESFSKALANTFGAPHTRLRPDLSLSSLYAERFRTYQSVADFTAETLN